MIPNRALVSRPRRNTIAGARGHRRGDCQVDSEWDDTGDKAGKDEAGLRFQPKQVERVSLADPDDRY